MIVEDLTGRFVKWIPKGSKNLEHSSINHRKVKLILQTQYPTLQILEEVSFKPRPYTTLYFDFFLPLIKTAIEVQGEQHYKYIPHFHNTRLGFLASKKRDELKSQWCDINNIILICIDTRKPTDKWIDQLC